MLASILLNNGNTGVAGMDGILGLSLGINWAQLEDVREMETEN